MEKQLNVLCFHLVCDFCLFVVRKINGSLESFISPVRMLSIRAAAVFICCDVRFTILRYSFGLKQIVPERKCFHTFDSFENKRCLLSVVSVVCVFSFGFALSCWHGWELAFWIFSYNYHRILWSEKMCALTNRTIVTIIAVNEVQNGNLLVWKVNRRSVDFRDCLHSVMSFLCSKFYYELDLQLYLNSCNI